MISAASDRMVGLADAPPVAYTRDKRGREIDDLAVDDSRMDPVRDA